MLSGKLADRSTLYSSGKTAFWLIPILVIAIALGFWLTQSKVKLTEEHYATAIALYRVCNQRSLEGLQEIETAMLSMDPSPDSSDPSAEAILTIIHDAKAERWEAAAQNCRTLLDDQVQR